MITAQDDVLLENLTLLTADPKIAAALAVLKDAGISTGEQFDRLQRITPTKQASRKAKRALLDELVKTAVGKLLAKHSLKHAGRDFDKTRENFKVVKSAIDLRIRKTVPSGATTRSEYSAADLDHLINELPKIVDSVEEELRHG